MRLQAFSFSFFVFFFHFTSLGARAGRFLQVGARPLILIRRGCFCIAFASVKSDIFILD